MVPIRTLSLVLGALAAQAIAQPISVGLKGGVPFSDAFKLSGTTLTIPASTRSLIIGPTVEIHLPFGLGVEVDALHRSLSATSTDTGSQWEFPILLKHYFLPGPVRPYGEGGISFNHLSGFSSLAKSPVGVITSGTVGFTAGGGIELKISRIRIAPEIRLTFWKDPNINFTISNAGVIS